LDNTIERLKNRDSAKETLDILFYVFIDIEECSTKKDNCHVDAKCTNTKGSVDTLEMEPLVLVNEPFPPCLSGLAARFIGAMKIISRYLF